MVWYADRGRYIDYEDDDDVSPQERVRCACPSFGNPITCIADRYNLSYSQVTARGERCECVCHDMEDDDDA